MKNKRASLIAGLCVFTFLFLVIIAPNVSGRIIITVDGEDDVEVTDPYTYEVIDKGDYHDEIDIISFNITGRFLNVTFAGTTSSWGELGTTSHIGMVMFFSSFSRYGPTGVYYTLVAYKQSGDHIELWKWGETLETWNGSAWTEGTYDSANIGYFSTNMFNATIPIEASSILNYKSIIAVASCEDSTYEYIDYAPNDPFNMEDSIPGFNFIIIILVMLGISLIIIKIKIRKK